MLISRNLLVRGMPLSPCCPFRSWRRGSSAPASNSGLSASNGINSASRLKPLCCRSDEWLLVLIQSRQSLEAQQQQQERWVSDVAHELKTPLTALMLVSDRLEMAVEGKDTVLVQRLQRELRRLQLMVEDLLELSRLRTASGKRQLFRDHPGGSGRQRMEQRPPLAEVREVTMQLDRTEPNR